MIFGVSSTKNAVVIAQATGSGKTFSIRSIQAIEFQARSGRDLKELLQRLVDIFDRGGKRQRASVALLASSSGRFKSSVEAIKAEAIAELAAAESGLPVVKVTAASLKKALGCATGQKWQACAAERFNPTGRRKNWSNGAAGAGAAALKAVGLFVVSLAAAVSVSATSHTAAEHADVTIAAGNLVHHRLSNELFQLGELWIRVAENTEFHRWLSQGIDHEIAIVLTTKSARLSDEAGTRILTGKLVHETAPNPTPNTVNVTGQLPPGNLPMVHIVFLRDELTDTLGAVTLQTSDRTTASKFEGFDDIVVSIVISVKE